MTPVVPPPPVGSSQPQPQPQPLLELEPPPRVFAFLPLPPPFSGKPVNTIQAALFPRLLPLTNLSLHFFFLQSSSFLQLCLLVRVIQTALLLRSLPPI